MPPVYQQPRGYTNVPSNIGRDKGKGPRLGFQFDGTVFVSAWGQHQMKAGLQIDHVGLDALAGGTGNGIVVFWDRSFMGTRGPFGYYTVSSNDRLPNRGFITEGNATVDNVGLFLQDAWTIGRRFTIHVGLRTEKESVPSLSPDPRVPDTAIRFGFDDKLAPRLGVAWDAAGDGKTKIYGSWGVFYDITKLQLSFAFGGGSSVGYWYTLRQCGHRNARRQPRLSTGMPRETHRSQRERCSDQRPRRQSHRSRTPSNATPRSGGWRRARDRAEPVSRRKVHPQTNRSRSRGRGHPGSRTGRDNHSNRQSWIRAGEHILSRAQHDAASVTQGEARVRRRRGRSRPASFSRMVDPPFLYVEPARRELLGACTV